jgi:glucoamylase
MRLFRGETGKHSVHAAHAGTARKLDIATAIGETSRVWFTLARGRLDEVYFPRPDHPVVRALRLSVDGHADDEAAHALSRPDERVPLLVIDTRGAPYQLSKETIADPRSDAVLQRIRSSARLRVDLAPELDVTSAGPFDHHGELVITATLGGYAVALAASTPWAAHDGLHGELAAGDVTLALGFGDTPAVAAHIAVAALDRGYDVIRSQYVAQWHDWHDGLRQRSQRPLWARSACVLKTLETKSINGGRVAALAKPWGAAREPGASGSYHLVWTRDLVETIGGLVAAGAHAEVDQALTYLGVTQRRDGHWPQNMKIDGTRVWRGDESDETALPILLVDLLRRERLLDDDELADVWPLVHRAATRLATTGPSTQLDRWESIAGITPFTVASEIAALRVAAALAGTLGHDRVRHHLATLAEQWDASIETHLYRRGGPLADRLGIAGYYVRARRPGEPLPELDVDHLPPSELSPDALALVRFGVRPASDPRIADTARAIDAVLRTEVGWRRFPGDEYGEHEDGAPWDGDGGIGRSWPLLVGERAHFELARGDALAAERLCAMMVHLAGPTGMLPEQTWDAADIPRRGLAFGQPTHSAAPLGWAHAEYAKLCRSLAEGRVWDLPRGLHEPGR